MFTVEIVTGTCALYWRINRCWCINDVITLSILRLRYNKSKSREARDDRSGVD